MRKSYNAQDSFLQQSLTQPKVKSVKIENRNAYLVQLNNYAQFQVIWIIFLFKLQDHWESIDPEGLYLFLVSK